MPDGTSAPPSVPRDIWLYWEQGLAAAPAIVHLCVSSWRMLNPAWIVHVIDRDDVDRTLAGSGIDLDRPDWTVQKRSNAIRLALLHRYGGVWTDASTYCWTPLADWLPDAAATGFFAFRRPGPDRLLANWFLAAHPENPLLRALDERYSSVWQGRVFDRQEDPETRDLLRRLRRYYCRDPQATLFWTSSFALDYLRAYPYFIFHYVFNTMVLTDPELGAAWDAVPSRSAIDCFLLKRGEADEPDRVLEAARAAGAPVQKLPWRLDPETPYWRAVRAELTSRLTGSPS